MSETEDTDSIEVHILQDEQWRVHATYTEDQREEAFRAAGDLKGNPLINDVRVVQKPAAPSPSREMVAGAEIPDFIDSFDPDEQKAGSTFYGLFVRLLLLILSCLLLATFFSFLVSVWVQDTALRVSTQENILISTFLGSFGLAFITMAVPFFSRARQAVSALKVQANPVQPDKPSKPKPAPGEFTGNTREEDEALDEFRREAALAHREHADTLEEPAFATTPDALDINASLIADKQRLLTDFLRASLEAGGIDKGELDSFNKFGVSLFIAGACQALGQWENLHQDTESEILIASVRHIGFKEDKARVFKDKVQDYRLADARYGQAFEAGREAMNGQLTGDGNSVQRLKPALDDWNRPKEAEAPASGEDKEPDA